MKIRGNAAHVAEKYMSLARDALTSGDPITAENYLRAVQSSDSSGQSPIEPQ